MKIVPGITSAIAVPAYAGIPVTYRHVATSFTVVTGHEDPNKPESTLDWSVLAKAETLIILMGLSNLEDITLKLIEHKCPSETPIAVIHKGTLAEQRIVVGTLRNIVGKVYKAELKPPVILVVGEVVSLREKLEWFTVPLSEM